MAELEMGPRILQWGRHPEGPFYIAAMTQIPTKQGVATVPLYVWKLSTEEEAALKAALAGVVLTNGHNVLGVKHG